MDGFLGEFFQRCEVVSLARRPEKWAAFEAWTAECWPFVPPTRFNAIDGKNVPQPGWWTQGGGSWGCAASHRRIIETALQDNIQSLLVLEEDAEPAGDRATFAARCEAFLRAVPKGWAMLYLGGQHLFVPQHPPLLINEQVVVPFNINRTHAYALSRQGMIAVYKHLHRQDWKPKHHIDHHLGRLHEERKLPIYCPTEWLLQQAPGQSDVCGKRLEDRAWQVNPAKYKKASGPLPWEKPLFFAIVGLHSSGSSAIAGVCYHLGVHLGDHLQGFYGNDPDKSCGFEARGLAAICERVAPFPTTTLRQQATMREAFRKWIAYSWQKARQKGKVAGGKYPHLCRLGGWLREMCGDGLRVIHCVRPLEDSIRSLIHRQGTPVCTEAEARTLQEWLQEGKETLLGSVPAEHRLDVDFYQLLADPRAIVEEIAAFLGTNPSQAQINKAVEFIQPEKVHVRAA